MGQYFDRESLLARRRQFESYAEWERDHPETLSPAEALDATAELCSLFPPPPDAEEDLEAKCAGIAKMREYFARIGPPRPAA